MGLRMAKADQNSPRVPRLEQFLPRPMKNDERFSALFFADLHILPAELSANPGPEGFGNRFLGRKPRCQKWSRRLVRQTITNLVRMQYPLQKAIPEPFIRRLYPRHFDNINANSQNHSVQFSYRSFETMRCADHFNPGNHSSFEAFL